jgi:hypothetical protein
MGLWMGTKLKGRETKLLESRGRACSLRRLHSKSEPGPRRLKSTRSSRTKVHELQLFHLQLVEPRSSIYPPVSNIGHPLGTKCWHQIVRLPTSTCNQARVPKTRFRSREEPFQNTSMPIETMGVNTMVDLRIGLHDLPSNDETLFGTKAT